MENLYVFLALIAGGTLAAITMGIGFVLGYRARAGYEPKPSVSLPFSIPKTAKDDDLASDGGWEEEWERCMRGLAKDAGLLAGREEVL